ncbi:hypothetical protein [Streptomyces sp. NPDC051310]|uniref:hypothetical protein n=1 Tax=Streptomyces sp. NPDC051310 TaxID=3365649 RepID=UPI0037A01B00
MSRPCRVPPGHDPEVIRTVYAVGRDLGVSGKVMLAGFEAGWVESHMNNLDCGDKDSLGVFQQRPSQGWGTPEQIMDVSYAAGRFLHRAVQVERRCPDLTPGRTAQEVQRSAHPERYDEAEAKARELLEEARRSADPADAAGTACPADAADATDATDARAAGGPAAGSGTGAAGGPALGGAARDTV